MSKKIDYRICPVCDARTFLIALSLQPTRGDMIFFMQCSKDSTHIFRVEFKAVDIRRYTTKNIIKIAEDFPKPQEE